MMDAANNNLSNLDWRKFLGIGSLELSPVKVGEVVVGGVHHGLVEIGGDLGLTGEEEEVLLVVLKAAVNNGVAGVISLNDSVVGHGDLLSEEGDEAVTGVVGADNVSTDSSSGAEAGILSGVVNLELTSGTVQVVVLSHGAGLNARSEGLLLHLTVLVPGSHVLGAIEVSDGREPVAHHVVAGKGQVSRDL